MITEKRSKAAENYRTLLPFFSFSMIKHFRSEPQYNLNNRVLVDGFRLLPLIGEQKEYVVPTPGIEPGLQR